MALLALAVLPPTFIGFRVPAFSRALGFLELWILVASAVAFGLGRALLCWIGIGHDGKTIENNIWTVGANVGALFFVYLLESL